MRTDDQSADLAWVHPSAIVEEGAILEKGVKVWHFAHVRAGASIGSFSSVGNGVYVGPDVVVGHRCKIQNGAQLFEPCALADGVFVGPGVICTNDRRPRAVGPTGRSLESEDWTGQGTTVYEGASLGAGSVLVSGVSIGQWAMVAAGAVVASNVDPYRLATGVPARHTGFLCRCGHVLTAAELDASMLFRRGERVWCSKCLQSEHDRS